MADLMGKSSIKNVFLWLICDAVSAIETLCELTYREVLNWVLPRKEFAGFWQGFMPNRDFYDIKWKGILRL